MSIQLSHRFSAIDENQKNWGWFLTLGIVLIILGLAVMSSAYYATVFSVFLLGLFLVGGGAIQIVHAFMARKWSGLFLSMLLGVLYIVTGAFCVARPAIAAVSITLWIAVFLIAIGIFRMITSAFMRFDQWGWIFFNGLITLILGLMIAAEWPLSGLWVIGLFIGIDLLLAGWTWVLLSLGARENADGKA